MHGWRDYWDQKVTKFYEKNLDMNEKISEKLHNFYQKQILEIAGKTVQKLEKWFKAVKG